MRFSMSLLLVGFALAASGSIKAEEVTGKKLFEQFKCASCHAVSSLSIKVEGGEEEGDGEEAPDLSKLKNLPKIETLEAFLMKKEAINGKKHPKKFKGTPEELKALSTWILSLNAKK